MDAATMKRYELAPGETSWPTVALFIGAFTAQAALATLGILGALPAALASLLCVLPAYSQFTVVHDAVHRSLSRRAWINESFGAAAALVLFGPFDAFRRNHLHHHAHTNDPHEDPDFYAAGESWTGTAARCLTMLQWHYWTYLTGLRRRDAAFVRTLATIALIAVVLIGAARSGLLAQALLYWFLPAQLAVAALAFLFDYLPHRPHLHEGRLRDTAAVTPRYLDAPMMAQNLHLIHHLYPTIPWYRYRPAFVAAESWLRSQGALLWDMRTALAKLRPSSLRRLSA